MNNFWDARYRSACMGPSFSLKLYVNPNPSYWRTNVAMLSLIENVI